MRILLDLQACQTEGSKNRGIGRYSVALAEAMIRQGPDHEFFILLNGAFSEAADVIRKRFAPLLPPERFRTFEPVMTGSKSPESMEWQYQVSQHLRDDVIASIDPDVLHITSLFEWIGDSSVTETVTPRNGMIQAITLYDLIPYINAKPYLEGAETKRWYYKKLQSLKRADLLLAISASSREEAIEYLHTADDLVVNISSAIDPSFQPSVVPACARDDLRARYEIHDRFIMYTGGIDFRKNIEGLIEAFSLIGEDIRSGLQLAIVCSITSSQRTYLLKVAEDFGLRKGDIILTGYVSEKDLITFCNACDLFVFPSLHEGFGLPVLEAMACGAPVIGSDCSSIPEVIGLDEALFNPKKPSAIAAKMEEVLRDPALTARLRKHGLEQAKKFSWDASARTALAAFERHAGKPVVQHARSSGYGLLRLALISPFPPLNTGIAGYSAMLLPELSRFYQVDIVTNQDTVSNDWASANCEIISTTEFARRDDAGYYDRIMYHFGNSDFHADMFDLLVDHPGMVVLHDLFLSGAQNWRQDVGGVEGAFVDALLAGHGYPAITDLQADGTIAAMDKYPSNWPVMRSAAGVVVHSKSTKERLDRDFGSKAEENVRYIPLVRSRSIVTREAARAALKLTDDDILICSFGIIADEKLNHVILSAFVESGLNRQANVRLVFVGSTSGEYGESFNRKVRMASSDERVIVTGFVDDATYHNYLAAADLAVQLRGKSRGETSAAALDVLNYGVPLIVNAHGTMAELDRSSVVMLPDKVTSSELANEMVGLLRERDRGTALSDAARALIRHQHNPGVAGVAYRDAIEYYWQSHPVSRHRRLIRQVAQDAAATSIDIDDLVGFSAVAARNLVKPGPKRILVDISRIVDAEALAGDDIEVLLAWLVRPIDGARIEPVYIAPDDREFRYARRFMLSRLGCPTAGIVDDVVEPNAGDIFIGASASVRSVSAGADHGIFQRWKGRGVPANFVLRDGDLVALTREADSAVVLDADFATWLVTVSQTAETIFVSSAQTAETLARGLDVLGVGRSTSMKIIFPREGHVDDLLDLARGQSSKALQSKDWRPKPMHLFTAKSDRLATVVGDKQPSIIASTGTAGILVFGPYLALRKGLYHVKVWGHVGESGFGESLIEATVSLGKVMLGSRRMQNAPDKNASLGVLVSMELTLEEDCTDLEVRIWVDEATTLHFSRLDVRPVL